MEKLVLRGIMYGADKIPDSWFDRVPGGYYKSQPAPDRDRREPRRRSAEYDDRAYDDRYERREKRRDSHRSRSSFDRDDRDDRRRYDDYDDRYTRDNKYHEEPEDIAPEDLRPEDIAAGGFAAGVAAANVKHEEQQQQYTGYVPYSNIYGTSSTPSQTRDGAFSPPPRSSVSSPKPHAMNQVSPPRRMSVEPEHYHPRDYRGYDGHNDYDDRARMSRPRLSRLRSRSYDSYDSRAQPWRDPRDGRRDSPRGKSQSRLKTTFDKSKRGLGYSAAGAVAGGLVGSELGGGVSATIGAVLGGLGANMFEARERRKDVARSVEYAQDDDMTARRERRQQERRDSRGGSWVG